MASMVSEALLVLTSWNTASDDLTAQPTKTLVKDFCENTLKSDEVPKLYCTVLDVGVGEDQKKDAESVGVTLIPATRRKWSDPEGDPPAPNWLLNHDKYYPRLKDLQNVKHVVSFSSKTNNAAAAIHESLFPQTQLHQISVPPPPGVLFTFDAWSKHACGLTGYHRTIIQDFLVRKEKSGEYLKAYSTVIDVELSADQIEDAQKCGVTLIKAERQKGVNEMPNIKWLMYHYNHLPDLQKLQNIKYVVGYAPKTGWAAVDIQKKLFPDAKLVLINHVCQEHNCLLVKDEFPNLEQDMLKMASQADLLFSIGPHIYGHFKSAYRAAIEGRKLYDIPHKKILPKPGQLYFDNESLYTIMTESGHSILTYGQLDTEEALKRCDSIAASIGSAVKKHKDFDRKPPKWKIHGVSEQAYKATKRFLYKKLQTGPDTITSNKQNTVEILLQSLQQSDLCLPPSCYTDYSFEGLEAMAAGLPTTVQDDSHIAAMIDEHFKKHKDYCVVRKESEELTCKITKNLIKKKVAVKQAKLLKKDLAKSTAVTKSLAKFASSLTDERVTQNFDKDGQTELKDKKQKKLTALITKSVTESHGSITGAEDIKTAYTTIAHQQGMPNTRHDGNSERLATPKHKDQRKTKDKNNDTKCTHPQMLRKKDGVGRKRKSSGAEKGGQKESEARKPKIQRIGRVSRNPGTPPPSPHSIATGNDNDSTDFTVHIGLNKKSYVQQMRYLNKLVQTNSVRKKKKKLQAKWKKCQAEFEKNSNEVIANEEGKKTVNNNCKKYFGVNKVKSTKTRSVAIHLELPTLYNLYRLEHTCQSGSFPDSFEPLLITDKMREETDKVGLKLKLKATYDQARFDELELFFINRDGGGLEPVKVYDDVIEGKDAEEIQIDDEDTDQNSDNVATERVVGSYHTEQKQFLEGIQFKPGMERATLESRLKEAKEEKASLEERCKELTQKLESSEQSLVSQRIENSVKQKTLQSKVAEKKKLIKKLQDKVTELEDKVAELEHKLEQSELKKTGDKDMTNDLSSGCSLTLVNGQHQDQGKKLKRPRGIAFHHDKLVVCDSGNNIVQILNNDYTCDKVLGSFDGQFTKPFWPLSVAISHCNHYFILDDENKQIVVCDESGKIIQIITLPETIEVVWDIALMDIFVLVTLNLTSPDTTNRPEETDGRLIKYTQAGQFDAEVGTQLKRPMSVVVNSNNIIIVYDSGLRCIKCFDSILNFLYQYGESQLPTVGISGYIAVDEDDNVYVCDMGRIIKYRCDGKWICNLLQRDAQRGSMYIAVMADKIGIVEYQSDQIKVYSKK